MDSPEEMKQLCVSLCFSLGITNGFDIVIEELKHVPEDATFDIPQLAAWFLTKFEIEDNREQDGTAQVVGLQQ